MSELKNKKIENMIGVFDSGLGGLTILKDFLKILPKYNYIYLGDNARVPYGEKSPETIYEYAQEAADFLFAAGCNLIIIACNTASAQA
jgi:glutamate racemase